jgi:hypothetical protein
MGRLSRFYTVAVILTNKIVCSCTAYIVKTLCTQIFLKDVIMPDDYTVKVGTFEVVNKCNLILRNLT